MTQPVTVVRPVAGPRPRIRQVGSVLTPVLLAVLLFIRGDRVVAAMIAAAAVLLYPLFRRANRLSAQRRPAWIEIRPDRIAAIGAAGYGSELVRTGSAVLQVRKLGGRQRLYLVGPAGDDGSIDLDGFDVQQVGTAAVAQGWEWVPPGSTPRLLPAYLPDEPPARADEVQIRLREGTGRPAVNRAIPMLAGIGTVVAVLVTTWTGLPAPAVVAVAAGCVLAGAAALLSGVLLSMRRGPATIVISADRLAVRYGSLSAHVVERSAIATARVGARWARLRTPAGKHLAWVPLQPKRDEVLAALQRYGWPVSESPGGITRH